MKLAYLGPEGTFSETAARRVAGPGDVLVACRDIEETLLRVCEGSVDRAVVPIENAINGVVTATLDALAADERLRIRAELELPVDLVVAGHPGTVLSDVHEVHSHPVPLAGCARWLRETVPDADRLASSSTSRAAAHAAAGDGSAVAITNRLAAERHDLEVLATDVADVAGNRTRFLVVGSGIPPRTGHDKTSLFVFIHNHRPGALHEMLGIFAERGINLTRIESRPTKHELGDYFFYLDAEGHVADERLGDALAALRRTQRAVTVLGSYPRNGGHIDTAATQRLLVDDETHVRARDWLAGLRGEVEPTV